MVDHVLIDVRGIAPFTYDPDSVVDALGLEGRRIQDTERLDVLAQLVEGDGYTVLTGPLGADFWSVVSPEIVVKVVPDDYQVTTRLSTRVWGLITAGFSRTEAERLSKKPVKRGKNYEYQQRGFAAGEALSAAVRSCTNPLRYDPYPVRILTVAQTCALLNKALDKQVYLALDWEWHRQTREPVGLALSSAKHNYYCPLWGSDYPKDVDGGLRLRKAFSDYLRKGGRGVVHGGRADLGVMFAGDLHMPYYKLDDSMVMAYLLGYSFLGLKPLTKIILHRDPIENEYEWADQPVKFTARYAAGGDTRNTYDLARVFTKRLKTEGRQWDVYEEIERPLVPIVADMERTGIPIDISAVIRHYREYAAIEYGLRYAVRDNYGRDLANSRDKEAETRRFIVDCGFPDPGTVDQRVISLNPHWCIDLIMEYRRYRTRRRGFLKKIIKAWNIAYRPKDFRIFPRFNQAGSVDQEARRAPRSGRFSSSGGEAGATNSHIKLSINLQNQPRDLRDIYIPPPGYKWWSKDYSGMELRLAASLSGDPKMLATFLQEPPGDPHDEFRQAVLARTGVSLPRPHAKTGKFEQLYEGGAGQLQRILAKQRSFLPLTYCQAMVDTHHSEHYVYHGYGQLCVLQGRRDGYIETIEGRRRRLIYGSDDVLNKHEDRACINHRIQGSGADIIKRAMYNVYMGPLWKHGGTMAITVHDELDGWIPEDADPTFGEELDRAMLVMLPRGIKLVAEGKVGMRNWAEAH